MSRAGRCAAVLAATCVLALSFINSASALPQLALATGNAVPAFSSGSAGLTGLVTRAETGKPIEGAGVCAEQPGLSYCVASNASGEYAISGIPAGVYHVEFRGREANFVYQFYNGKHFESEATAVSLGEGQTLTGIDAALKIGAVIEGKVTSAATSSALAGVYACAFPPAPHEASAECAATEASGDYKIQGLEAGEYTVRFSPYGQNYLTQFYNDELTAESANPISVTNGQTVVGIDAAMQSGGEITGTVSVPPGDSAGEIQVCAIPGKETAQEVCTQTASDGTYVISALHTHEYRVVFFGRTGLLTQYYHGRASLEAADPVDVTAGSVTAGIDASMQEGGKIKGTVTAANSGTPIVEVEACARGAGLEGHCGETNAAGEYTIEGIASGSYTVQFYSRNGSYLSSYYAGVELESEATHLSVTAGASVTGIDEVLQPAAKVTGTVVEQGTGTPISGAQVCVRPATFFFFAGFQCTTSGAGGAYVIAGLRSSWYRVEFSASGFLRQYYGESGGAFEGEPVYLAQGGSVEADAALEHGGSIAGRVTSASTSQPLAGIDVCPSPTRLEGKAAACARTGSNGEYTITGVAAGEYTVSFSGAEYPNQYYGETFSHAAAKHVAVKGEQTTSGVNDALRGGGAISGIVTAAATGDPLEGITVCPETFSAELCAKTGPSGAYEISKLPPGEYSVVFEASKGYVSTPYPQKVSVSAETTTPGIDAAMQPVGDVTGVVHEASTGSPLAGVQVCAYQESEYIQLFGTCVETKTDGAYAIEGLAGGHWVVGFTAHASKLARQFFDEAPAVEDAKPVLVEDGKTAENVNANMLPGGEIGGLVSDGSGGPVAGAEVCIELQEEEPGEYRCANTGAEGTYSIAGLPSGLYRVEFRDTGKHYTTEYYEGSYWRSLAALVPVAAGAATEGIDGQLRTGGSVTGVVTDAATDLPLAGVEVCLNPTAPKGEPPLGPFEPCALAGPAGEYALKSLMPGEYELTARSPNRRFSAQQLTSRLMVAPEQTDANVDVAMVPGGKISGEVTDEHGAPVEGGEVCATATGTEHNVGACARTNEKGKYTITGLEADSYRVRFETYRSNYVSQYYDGVLRASESQAVTVSPGGEVSGIDASLETGGEITGTVSATGGTPLEFDEVCVSVEEQSRCGVTESNGEYVVSGLPSGSYTVHFSSAQGFAPVYYNGRYHATEATPVSVSAGAITTGIDATLSSGGTISGEVTAASGGKVIAGVQVCAHPAEDTHLYTGCATTTNRGSYSIHGLDEGPYLLEFSDNGKYQTVFYDGDPSLAGATAVAVTLGGTKEGVDEQLVRAETGPTNIGAPVISGSPSVGSTLMCSNGSWSNVTPVTFSIRWLRDDVPIPGATGPGYTLTPADEGHALACEVTAREIAGAEASALSAPVAVPSLSGGGGSSIEAASSSEGHGSSTGGGSTGGGQAAAAKPAASLSGRMRFRAGALAVPLRCSAAFGICRQVTITLSVTETLVRGRVVGVSAAQPRHPHARARLIVIGSAKATLSSGATKDVLVHLNARGRALLEQWRSLPVRVEIADHSGVLETRVVRIHR